jgi:hypothetical protein
MIHQADLLRVIAVRRNVCDGGQVLAAVFSWPGFTGPERDAAWDRLEAAVEGGPAEIRAATDYLTGGPR